MSSYGYTHIGYYLIGKLRETTTIKHVMACEDNSEHKVLDNDKFCSTCGAPVIKAEVPEVEACGFYDIPEETFDGDMHDEFMMPEYISPKGSVVMVSNQGAGSIEIDDDSDSKIIDEEDLDKEVLYNQFMDAHAEHVRLIIQYVLDDVQIKFGIFRYYM